MRNAAGQPKGTAKFKPLPMGGGGYITGVSIAIDGTNISRTDVANAYIKKPGDTRRSFLFTTSNLAATEYGSGAPNNGALADGNGIYEAVVAPSNSNYIYATWNAMLYVSTDGAATFTRSSGFAACQLWANSSTTRRWGHKIAVDNQNPSVVVVGTMVDGLRVSSNAGSTWTNVTVTTPGTFAGSAAPLLVAVDPQSTITSTIRQVWYYASYGNGLFKSTTGPSGTYTHVAGGPSNISSLQVGPDGTVWCVDPTVASGNVNGIWKCSTSGTWSQPTTATMPRVVEFIAVDPTNANRLLIGDEQLQPNVSTDGGVTWTGYWSNPNIWNASNAIKWLGGVTGWRFNAQPQFDPSVSGRCWFPQGNGIAYATVPASTASRFNFIDDTLGIEELVVQRVVVPPYAGANLIALVWDQTIWNTYGYLDTPSPTGPQQPDPQNLHGQAGLEHGWDMEWAADNPQWLACHASYQNCNWGYSTDGGTTWTGFPAGHPDGVPYGGCIGVGNTGKMVVVPYNNMRAVYSTDTGATWNILTLPGSGLKSGAIYGSGNSQLTYLSASAWDTTQTYTVTIAAASGGGSVAYNSGTKTITITPASGGTTATAIAAQINASSTSNVLISATAGGTGAGTVSAGSVVLAFESGFQYAHYFNRKCVAVDKTTSPPTYYLYNYGPAYNQSITGLYKSTNDGATWTMVHSGSISAAPSLDYYHCRLAMVPGQTGHMFWCCGNDQSGVVRRSTDGGITWTDVANTSFVADVGFGKAAPGKSYPTIFFAGKLSGVQGVYRSDDNAATWVLLATRPLSVMADISCITGDPNIYGRVYIGYGGAGTIYADYDCPITVS